jgi:hypothetical protein
MAEKSFIEEGEESAEYLFDKAGDLGACTKTYKSVELYENVQGGRNG